MRAAVYHRYGPPEVVQIQDVPKPAPKDNEVLIRVRASTVCAADWRFRKADPYIVRIMNGLFKPKRMPILGMEFSGTVESVGKSVTRVCHGDEVFGGTAFKLGCHAEYVCVEEDKGVAAKPSNIPLEDTAAIFFGGATALGFLRQANIRSESLALSLAGGTLGTAFGLGGIGTVLALQSCPCAIECRQRSQIGEQGSAVALDWRVLAFTILVSLVTGVCLASFHR
jgi:NADPH:quinone reductase-like Zn-dependent oxidoreductase